MENINKAKYSNNITKLATIGQARERYKLSRSLLIRVAEENNAICRFGRAVRIDIPIMDKAIDKYKSMP